ncbi:hypothetical protein COV20_03610 [Candidatus Woesearchaeota archaeon CG10_big_fil_rev_8_21_14_0_10_45_16]|nr:MAG: hypothetical protein COV20_03610 [Candidatus Woesearchaeota archaeon CG10_big_fil_rev_8_21_14_0_10_45_16]
MYEPAEDSYLLQKQVKQQAIGRVLDVGTGSGIQALTAVLSPNVKEVIAVDINEEAVEKLRDKIRDQRLRKVKAVRSDLFDNVSGCFNLIIFNPPYLPQDKGIEDAALYGGKKGWEISGRFFSKVSKYLFPDGKILFLFSTLTNKERIEELIEHNLFSWKEKEKLKLAFETLYVYEVEKTPLLRELEKKNLYGLQYFTSGKRGMIYTALLDRSSYIKTHLSKKDVVKVAIKVKKPESKAEGTIENEVRCLKLLNKKGLGPKLLFSDDSFFVYEFVEGVFLLDWLQTASKEAAVKVLDEVLQQCLLLDSLGLNKEEMHHPFKHVLIDAKQKVTLLDFERCRETDKPHNATQFLECLCRMQKELEKKGIGIDVDQIRELAKEYKDTYDAKVLKNVLS